MTSVTSDSSGCAQKLKCPIDIEDLAQFCNYLDESQIISNSCSNNTVQQNDSSHSYSNSVCAVQNQVIPNQVPSICSIEQPPNVQKKYPVDVEDLGYIFNSANQSTLCSSQRSCCDYPQYTNNHCDLINSESVKSNRSNYIYGGDEVQNEFNPLHQNLCNFNQQSVQTQLPLPDPTVFNIANIEQAAIAYCTDEKWLACPASSYCPVYDPARPPLTSWQMLPCAQDFRNHYMEEDAYEEYLSNEKRKEKSRDAARCRRSRETDIFTDLATALPIPTCEVSNLDKASVMRLAIAHLKTRCLVDAVPKTLTKSKPTSEIDELYLKALDGFVLVLDNNGDIVYTSTNVKDYLGIPQMDLMGQSVFDYSHPCDHDDIRDSFSLKASEISEDHTCNLFLRLKCTLTSKGRKVNLKSATYKVIHCTGRLIVSVNNNNNNAKDYEDNGSKASVEREPSLYLVVVASPVPHPSNIEIPLGKYTFLSKHSLNMKFTYADDKLAEFLGWNSNELMGQSVFDFHHAQDHDVLDKSYKSLFHKGQCETTAYRFLNKNGGYAWVVTQATLIHCSRLQKPLSVVCVNYLLSGIEREDEIYSLRQHEARQVKLRKDQELPSVVPIQAVRKPLAENPISVTASIFKFQNRNCDKPQLAVPAVPRIIGSKENVEKIDGDCQAKEKANSLAAASNKIDESIYQTPPLTATASIFAPRTKDMNKGFLTFSEDQPGLTMLKDEPEDLTHLAPTPGDVCVPLDEPPFLTDMLDEFILSGNYCPLLPDGPADPLTEVVCRAQIDAQRNDRTGANAINANNCASLLDDDADDDGSNKRVNCNNRAAIILGCGLPLDPLRTSKDDLSSSASDGGASANGDPFMYRDTPSRCSLGTDLHSPALTKSPEGSGIGDSLSPNDSGGGGGGGGNCLSEDEMLMMSINDVIADDEMALRAPYIPMSDQDEALQLLISDDTVMWGPSSQSGDKKSKWLTDEEDNPNSSLAQLLRCKTSSKKSKDRGVTLVNPSHVLGQISVKNLPRENTAERERTTKRTYSYTTKSNYNNDNDRPHQQRQQDRQPTRHQNQNPNINNNNNNNNHHHHYESKRLKQSDYSSSSSSSSSPSLLTSLSKNAGLMINSNGQSSQLLQQLVSQQTPKSRSCWADALNNANNLTNSCRYDDRPRLDVVDTGGRTNNNSNSNHARLQQQLQQHQQSNSVLMNLLVSGCDVSAGYVCLTKQNSRSSKGIVSK